MLECDAVSSGFAIAIGRLARGLFQDACIEVIKRNSAMGHDKYKTSVIVIGRFVGYDLKEGYKVKRIKLLTPNGIQSIKLSKEARASLFRITLEAPLNLGTALRIQAEKKFDDGEMMLKARAIDLAMADGLDEVVPWTEYIEDLGQVKTVQIQVCDRGTCRKRGSQAVYNAVCQTIQDQGLSEQVTVQKTGCLNACKRGVNVQINGTQHSQVCPLQAVKLLDRYKTALPV
jgi:NADH:ubiquinone oxidoreductase subunit E